MGSPGNRFKYAVWLAPQPNGPARRVTDPASYPFCLTYFRGASGIGWNDIPVEYDGQTAGFLVEWDDLDAPGGASASPAGNPAAATKDAPFVNSLGMKFVPVPITGGPTDGKRVLFSIWETRVQDYEAFATETKREWPKPALRQGRDASGGQCELGGCDGLLRVAHGARAQGGQARRKEVYRLPSDHEWSCAVGDRRRKRTRQRRRREECQKIANVFPWGTVWPPPAGAGNFSGEEAARGSRDGQPIIARISRRLPVNGAGGQLPGERSRSVRSRRQCLGMVRTIGDPAEPRASCVADGVAIDLEAILLSTSGYVPRANYRAANCGFRVVLAPVP